MDPIAIIGVSCRFPQANGPDEFWHLLRNRRSAIGPVPNDRWDAEQFCDTNPSAPGKMISRFGGFVEGIKQFDCGFFGISPREATSMDPQQRMVLETAWEAFEDAGLPMDALSGSKTAVYVGIGPGDYSRLCMEPVEQIDAYLTTGNFLSVAADRVAYFFDLRGPSLAVDTACSSSLVCVHLACRSIECGEATLALAGGVNALISPPISISLSKAGAISPTGQCRAFDGRADGYVRGEGAGFVVLKRLQDAIADRDRIYAVIRGTAVNQSGRRNGLTAPGSWGEEAVMLSAWQASGMEPSAADYVEAHGTGTVLGDAIEASALGRVFGERNGHGPCRIGSVKTNIGHLETAAGIAGLIKVALMMWHGEFVPSLYPEKPNPHVDLGKLGLTVQMRTEAWAATSASQRVGGVSSFGLGGTYAHACLISPEATSADAHADISTASGLLIPISARHPEALRSLVRDTARLIDRADFFDALDICRASARRRTHHDYRVAFAGLSPAELAMAMDWWLQKSSHQVAKVRTQRRLVVLVSAIEEFDQESVAAFWDFGVARAQVGNLTLPSSQALVRLLYYWGIRPRLVFRLAEGRVLADRAVGAGAGKGSAEIGLDEIRTSGDDFLDLTRDNFLARLNDLPNGTVVTGFSSSEPPKLTVPRLVAELYQLGYPLAWSNIYPGPAKHVSLPRYPWQHQTCWWESRSSQPAMPVKTVTAAAHSVPSPSSNGNLQALLARVTGRSLGEIQPEASPSDLGIDSLMTIELQEELKREFGVLLPVDTLVKVHSVLELEHLLVKERSASTAETRPAPPLLSQERRPSTEIREASLADYEQITALSSRNGLGIKTREEWEHLWINNPVYKKVLNWPLGWVVQNGADIVGFLGNIPLSYHFKGREMLAASIYAFSLDVSHRGHGLLLLNRLLESPAVEYFVGSTANASSAAILDRVGIARVPVGDWESTAFWITNHHGFVNSAISQRGWPHPLAAPAWLALATHDKLLKRPWPRQSHQLRRPMNFDERFEVFWQELQRTYPNRFLPTRSREVLDWHFKFALAQNKAWIATYEEGSRILAYAVFHRQDNNEINLKRVRLVDFQTLTGDSEVLVSMLAWGLRECHEQGIHMLEAFGFHPDKQRVIDRLAPHRRKLSGWRYFHKATTPLLQQELQEPGVWDPSQFDGDASL